MPFILTIIAGLSTLLGTIPIFIKFKDENKIINTSLSFAVGIMITVSIFDLIPESYNLLNKGFISVIVVLTSINVGIILSMIIDKFIPNDNNLYRVGVISLIAIIMHNIPEGIATYISSTHNIKLGLTLSIAIALHNIPEGISIALPIYYATKSKYKAILLTTISALSEIVGAILAGIFLKDIINDTIMSLLLGIVAGIMLYISIYELLNESLKYRNLKRTIVSIIVGGVVMLLSIFIIK